MGLCGGAPEIPDPADAAVAGIQADQQLMPFNYLINAAAQMGTKYTDPTTGIVYDFTGLGQADTARVVSDQMAATLLAISKEKSPQIIAQQLEELKAADPTGYAARQGLFDKIMAEANANPDRPLANDTNNLIQAELARGVGFADDKQRREFQDTIRGNQARTGITLGNAKTSQEAKGMVQAGESLQNQRQQSALNLLSSGATPEDIAYRKLQQTLGNLGSFANGTTPEAQFGQVSSAQGGPVSFTGNGVNTNTSNPNAAGDAINNMMRNWNTTQNWNQSQANPWMGALSTGVNAGGAIKSIWG